MSGTVRMTGISDGPNSEDQTLIFYDKDGRVFDTPNAKSTVSIQDARNAAKAKTVEVQGKKA